MAWIIQKKRKNMSKKYSEAMLAKVIKLFCCVMLANASMARAMTRESREDFVTIMIADAQDGGEPERGILKRESSEAKKKKAVTWGAVSAQPHPGEYRQPGQQVEQKPESKSEGNELAYFEQSGLVPSSCKPEVDPWHLQVPNLVDTLLSNCEQSALHSVGLEKHHFIQAFIELWPTQEQFQESGKLADRSGRGDSDRGYSTNGDNSDNGEAVNNNRQILFLAALAAQQNKKNDQRLVEINSKRARLKPYGYVLWPVVIMGVCFCETIAARYWCIMRG
jgi:hypothetical protein